ncbi:unnamed protein product [Notodromas monacha]|uniref:SAP domain-containing protein n=1 Tax=Notodromas monacha TaxID=399045 RepID=A0A7R9GHR0_9CRUS|nr:unnamed protein product [Notodromas monacha]CAG0921615.1 unnamed protein product [Notodromas monacha]
MQYETLDELMAGKKLSFINGEINSMNVEQLRVLLSSVGMDPNGPRSVLQKRLKDRVRLLHFGYDKFSVYDPTKVHVFYDCLVVVDFECTCVENEFSNPKAIWSTDYKYEIIEFPAILVDCATLTVTSEFHEFVRPSLNPVLSEYCVELLGIKQDQVDRARSFPDVLTDFNAWLSEKTRGKKFALVSDGPTDFGKFFFQNCRIHDLPVPKFAKSWVNVKKIFGNHYDVRQRRLADMLYHLGLPFIGRLHSGIDDARNIARITIQLLRDGVLIYPNERLVIDRNRSVDAHITFISSSSMLEEEEESADVILDVIRIKRELAIEASTEEFLKSDRKVRTTVERSPTLNRGKELPCPEVSESEPQTSEDAFNVVLKPRNRAVRSLAANF